MALASLAAPSWAAERAGPKRSLQESLGASVNNLGLQNTLDLAWSWPLSSSENPLRKDAHLSLGLSHALTPSYTRLAAFVELSPLSILDVRVGIEPAAYFGTFGNLISFSGYSVPFDKETRDARKAEASAGTGLRTYVSPTLKLKLGSVIAVASADFEWWRSSAAGPLFYEPMRDTLLETSGDGMVAVSSVLLHERTLASRGTLAYGLIHQLTYVYDAPGNRIQRAGVVVARQFAGKRFRCQEPRVAGYLSYYLDDPSKKNQLGAALGVSFKLGR
jgi:hypothetical protein